MTIRHMILFTTALSGAMIGLAGTATAQDAAPAGATQVGSDDEILVTGYRRSLADAIETKRRCVVTSAIGS